jgi:folate-binding protein YgfZ
LVTRAREIEWLKHSAGVRSLSERTIISVSGDDWRDWLQGQITNELQGVEPGHSVYAFVLTLKGRILADVWALVRDKDIWLDVPATQVDALIERLDRYVIMEDVDLQHRPDLCIIAAQGPRAHEVAENGWPADRLGVGGRQWVVPKVELQSELARLTEASRRIGGGPIGEIAWSHAHVVLGRPRFGVDFGEWTYPQESGLKALAVSFTKGCYIGQETVVMLESRGKAPKVLWRWAIEGLEPPEPSTPITLAGIAVGEVTSAVAEGTCVLALGFLKRGHDASGSEGFEVAGRPARPLSPVQAELAKAGGT